jgi:hypothetical protein
MENQDSVKQEKKKFFDGPGRKRKVIITVIVVLLLIGMMGRWATFGAAREGYGGLYPARSENVTLVVKDFEPRGIVFVEAAATAWDGYRATYDALMKEAAQKGADAIINVNISSKWSFLKRTWSGSALAVKYLDTLPEGYPVIQSVDNANTALMTRGWWFGR